MHIIHFPITYRYGRKKTTVVNLIAASIASIVAVMIPSEQSRKGIHFTTNITTNSKVQHAC